MKSNMITIIKKELARFFGDKRMVFSTILMPGLLIYVLYSFMGVGFGESFSTAEDYVYEINTLNLPDSFQGLSAQDNVALIPMDADELEEKKELLKDQETDLILVFPENFDSEVAGYEALNATGDAPEVQIYYNSVSMESSFVYNLVYNYCSQYESSLANKFDVNASLDIAYDMATNEDATVEIFSMMLPMLLLIFLFSGCMAIAPESIAGEKERGTIATLLVTPMKRSELAMGKIISLSLIALLSGISSFLGTILSFPKLMQSADSEGLSSMGVGVYGGSDFIQLLLVILSTALLIIGVISIISAMAKSVKEASTAVTPFMIVIMIISVTSMLGDGIRTEGYWYLIPIYNSVQCMTGIFSFTMVPLNFVITVGVNFIYTIIMVAVLTKIFDSEKIMYGM